VSARVAALFVESGGVYFGRPEVDAWDIERDATAYAGPLPVVAHPPCKRWGRWWGADGSDKPGNDGGLFASALASVERWGGVLEHPAHSHAWAHFGLPTPPRRGGWVRGLYRPGWSCHIEQRHYGHRARKATWLYYVGPLPPALLWGPGKAPAAYLCPPGRRSPERPGDLTVERMSAAEARATPQPFADLLIGLVLEAACRSR